jgi:alpha-ketoglutarate-dependent taurine dioxygenase
MIKRAGEFPDPSPVGIRRRAIPPRETGLVEWCEPHCGWGPLVFRPAREGVHLPSWAAETRRLLDPLLLRYGGILFRGFDVRNHDEFRQFVTATASGPLVEYKYRSTPRTAIGGGLYTSTSYPADQVILLHNEMSYSRSWPLKIWFYCERAAPRGGETTVADSRRVTHRLDPDVVGEFQRRNVLYVRNYSPCIDLPWQTVFGTARTTEVEERWRPAGIRCEWFEDGRLRTSQVCQAVASHPATQEVVWFNQAHLFHISAAAPDVREVLLGSLGETGLPRNAYYGDGAPIPDRVLDHVREVYEQESQTIALMNGDVLMLDNMLLAHGRLPFTGSRSVLVCMAEEHSFNFA